MELGGFKCWCYGFEIGDVTFAPLMLDYIVELFITYSLSQTLASLPIKSIAKWSKNVLNT